jgi:hypothetical protein
MSVGVDDALDDTVVGFRARITFSAGVGAATAGNLLTPNDSLFAGYRVRRLNTADILSAVFFLQQSVATNADRNPRVIQHGLHSPLTEIRERGT